MKLIIAVVRPHMLDKIVVALENIENFPGITVTETQGFGQRLRTTFTAQLNPFKPNKRIEIAATDERVEELVNVIRENAHTGKKGDGIIFVMPLEQAVLI